MRAMEKLMSTSARALAKLPDKLPGLSMYWSLVYQSCFIPETRHSCLERAKKFD
jgi:hypothetical protein